jgi:hypothetical protein
VSRQDSAHRASKKSSSDRDSLIEAANQRRDRAAEAVRLAIRELVEAGGAIEAALELDQGHCRQLKLSNYDAHAALGFSRRREKVEAALRADDGFQFEWLSFVIFGPDEQRMQSELYR